ncbi:hypothetical protein CHLNCDRAFT_142904 [Chlorella variabilis]|uniref:RRM domain-containing protein n=1 Tax=Chlorella variabilis TaxID=554065 RepID=E1Z912_CHLVA|nr:hypothetical protein CHLNCDRAFT_142904 [Chlorella variabilis]EFN57435.1 hypothetical protein CHLNCDRAFT_142904 [Chlorella variabilis]|eukprot:XP_005849537.1 hypothetical protein CHLNCDRAFT_142904 [Chlorella variabilis]
MMLPQMQQPGANQLPTPPATLKVSCIPSFVTSEDFGRLMRQLEGCVDARVLGRQPGGEQVGYAEFSDKLNASKAKNLYHGWTGWGGRGLAIELTDFSLSQLTQLPVGGQKRMREGEDLLQPNGNYKQPRADMPAMGMAGGLGGGQPQEQQDAAALGLLQNLSTMTRLLQQQGLAQHLLAATQQQQHQAGLLQPQQGLQHQHQQAPGMLQQQGAHQQHLGGGLPLGGIMQGQGPAGAAAGGGRYDGYNSSGSAMPATTTLQPSQQQQQVSQQQQLGGAMGGMLPPQQQQPAGQYLPQAQQEQQPQQQPVYGLQQEHPLSTNYFNQPLQQPQQQPQLLPPSLQQQGYSIAPPQQQPQAMLQTGMGQMSGMLPHQQPMMQQQQPQQTMQQQAPAQLMQPTQPQVMGMPGGQRGEILAPTAMRQYPPDACNTLYIEGLPSDVTRRELGHIFRSREGFRSLRLVIKDSKKHVGEKLVMAFVEYSSTYFAAQAMDTLQGYPFDLDNPETMTFFVKFARPMENPHRPVWSWRLGPS